MKTGSTTSNIKMIQTSLSKEFWEIKTRNVTPKIIWKMIGIFLFFYLFFIYLFSDTNKIYKYLQEELKGKSNFVQ